MLPTPIVSRRNPLHAFLEPIALCGALAGVANRCRTTPHFLHVPEIVWSSAHERTTDCLHSWAASHCEVVESQLICLAAHGFIAFRQIDDCQAGFLEHSRDRRECEHGVCRAPASVANVGLPTALAYDECGAEAVGKRMAIGSCFRPTGSVRSQGN